MTISDGLSGNGWHDPASLGAAGSGRPTAHDIATRMLAFSKARLQAFAPYDMVINDIAWELLLCLFVAQERGQRPSLRKLFDELPLPHTVTMRWVRALRACGLVRYDDDTADMPAHARLTPEAEDVMRKLITG